MNEPQANILLVDDAPDGLVALEAALADLDQNLVKACSGKEALKWLLENECAVILLDVRMPEMDGFETAALIRKRERSRRTPIIFVTAATSDETHVSTAYSLGAVDYLFKPIIPEIVRAKVEVFVDLWNLAQQREMERQRERDREVHELRQALAAQRALTGWEESSVTASAAGVGPLRERSLEVFAKLQEDYGVLLDRYLEALGFDESPPRREVNALADRLGDQGAGPRDLVDLHLRVVADKCTDVPRARALAYTTHGRLLALEVMGNLVDYYRTRRPAPVRVNENSDYWKDNE